MVSNKLFEMAVCMREGGRSLSCQSTRLNPSAQAPEMRVFMIPVVDKVRPNIDMVKAGSARKRMALMNVNIAVMEAMLLYFIIFLSTFRKEQVVNN